MMWSRNVSIAYIVLVTLVSQIFAQEVHQCVHASVKMKRSGDGTTLDSCMGCDPAIDECAPSCQGLVKQLYYQCDGVCLPEGYYFDPQAELTGCWGDVKPAVKIKVERCGCNSALSSARGSLILISLAIIAVVYVLL